MSFGSFLRAAVNPNPFTAIENVADAIVGVPEAIIGPVGKAVLGAATYGVSSLVIGRLDQQTRDEQLLMFKARAAAEIATARRQQAMLIIALRGFFGRLRARQQQRI